MLLLLQEIGNKGPFWTHGAGFSLALALEAGLRVPVVAMAAGRIDWAGGLERLDLRALSCWFPLSRSKTLTLWT